ncbi:conserved hypothetical protein [Trichinella spiralis]|uniref:hypothetical protein n=1 Tax=Trichinella spiralis TaxID=6334 RepID=UPI0001EFD453|nr:conserved hypothetical protein [Trichinella spiralis]
MICTSAALTSGPCMPTCTSTHGIVFNAACALKPSPAVATICVPCWPTCRKTSCSTLVIEPNLIQRLVENANLCYAFAIVAVKALSGYPATPNVYFNLGSVLC